MKKLGIFLIVLPLIMSSCFVLTGSYFECERYSVEMDNETIIQRFKQIKEEYPKYQVFRTIKEGEVYNPDHQLDYYYDTFFKLPVNDTTIFIQAIVRNDSFKDNAEVILIYSFGYVDRGWLRQAEKGKEEEHKMALQAFEQEVLEKLGVKYRRQRAVPRWTYQ